MSAFNRWERCENCWWKSRMRTDSEGISYHECRFNPPVLVHLPDHEAFDTAFPRVSPDDFCSKFEYRTIPKETA